MDYEKFKQDMEQDVLKNLANRGIEAETAVQRLDQWQRKREREMSR